MHKRLTLFRLATLSISLVVIAALAIASTNASLSDPLQTFTLYWQGPSTLDDPADVEQLKSVVSPPMTFGVCDTAGPIEVEASGGTVGPTPYARLELAVAAINAGTHTGTITIDVCGNTLELGNTISLKASGTASASYTSIQISPAGGASRTITGQADGKPLLELDGADNVTIDGLNTGGNSLTIANTSVVSSAGNSTVRFINGATNNTITNSSILGSATMSVTTNGGTIFFSTDGSTPNGNDNNSISNNNIGPAGSNLPTKGIYCNGSQSTTAVGNSGLLITNNNIYDYFGAATTSSGVAVNGGCNTLTITNNRFYQTAARRWTSSTTHRAIDLESSASTSGAQAMTVTGNIIGYSSNSQTGTYILTGSAGKFQGIWFSGITGGTVSNISNNTIASVSLTDVISSGTGSTPSNIPMAGIIVSNGVVNTNNNTIGNQGASSLIFSTSTGSATDVYGIYNSNPDDWTANGNIIGGISVTNSGAGTSVLYGIRANTSTTKTFNASSNSVGGTVANSLELNATGTSSQVLGLVTSNAAAILTSNTIRNLTTNIGSGTSISASVIGIFVNAGSANHTVTQNSIYNLANTNSTSISVVTGIQFSGSTASVVERNLIYGLTVATNNATSSEVNGIRVASGTTTYRNNMIAVGAGIPNAIGTGSTTGGVNGINEQNGVNNFYHNSIYIGGAPTAGTGPSYALNSNVTTNVRNYRDNIFYNGRSNNGATGKNYAVRVGGTAPNPAGLTINNNVYLANGAGGVFGLFNGADVANLAAWRTAVGQDGSSFEADPHFIDPTGSTPDLHIDPTVATVVEGTGADVGVTNDFDGQTRAGLTPVDIGADAGNFVSTFDVTPPGISYTVLPNTSSTANRTLSVLVTDASGVPTSGMGLPRLYFRKGTSGAYASQQCMFVSGSNYDCTFDYALVGGVVIGNTIQYFVAAQDNANNVAVNPSTGAGGLTASPPAASTPPTAPNSYLIGQAFSGSKTVCASGCDFANLTNAGGIFSAINTGVLTGNLNIEISGDLTGETGVTALNTFTEEPSGSNFTVKIYPTGGTPRSISGTTATAAVKGLIRLNAADRVTIDGSNGGTGTDRSLSITNTEMSGVSAVVWLNSSGSDGAQNNTIKNLNVAGADNNSTLFGIGMGSTSITTTSLGSNNNNNTIQNNNISKALYGIFSSGNPTTKNMGNLITQNVMSSASPSNVAKGGIWVGYEDNITISRNTISGISNPSGDSFGISAGSGNSFSSLTSRDDEFLVPAAGSEVTNATISGNLIGPVVATHIEGPSAIGIGVGNQPAGSTTTVVNNMVSGVLSPAVQPNLISGIHLGGGPGTTRVYFNSVWLSGTRDGDGPGFALSVAGVDPVIDIRNNIFSNTQTVSSGGKSYAIGLGSRGTFGNYVNLTSNYNDFYVSGPQGVLAKVGGLTQGGTDVTTLNGWQMETGRDANSISLDPLFVSGADLHLQSGSPAIDAGVTIGGITTDIDGQTRPQGPAPEIGADEVPPLGPEINVTGNSITIVDGDTVPSVADGTDYGNTAIGGGGSVHTFTIQNLGTAALNISGVSISNVTGGGSFVASAVVPPTVSPGGSTTFTVTFDPASTGLKTATVNIASDDADENPYDFTIQGTGITPGTLALSSATYLVNEGVGMATVTVNRTGGSDGSVGISYSTSNGTATGGSSCAGSTDFVNASGTLSWANGDSDPKTFQVMVCDDATYENNETVNLAITTPTGGATIGTPNTAVLTINNNDGAPVVSISGGSVVEGDGPSGPILTFNVTKAGPTEVPATVNFDTTNITATTIPGEFCGTNNIDYQRSSGGLTFQPNESMMSINVQICGDILYEGNETFKVTLSGGSGQTIGTAEAIGTIIDDENLPTISDIPDQTITVGNAVPPLQFTVNDIDGDTVLNTTATSSDQTLVPNSNLVITGTGSSRTLTVIPTAGQTGSATITVMVDDLTGGTAFDTFILTVNAATCTTPPNGMVAWWNAEGNATDIWGPHDGATTSVAYNTAKVGQGFVFTAGASGLSGSRIDIPYSSDFDIDSDGITIDFWMKAGAQSGGDATIVEKSHTTGGMPSLYNGWAFQANSSTDGKLRFAIGDGGAYPEIESDSSVLDNQFHHVAGTWSASDNRMRLYIDGALQTETAVTGTPLNNTGTLNFGYFKHTDSRYYTGLLDEVEIFQRTLTGAEIAALYNASSAGKCKVYHTLNITSVNGTVTKLPNRTQYLEGSSVQLTAAPDAGFNFVNWTGDVTSSANPISVVMNADKNVTANYSVTNTPGTIQFSSATYSVGEAGPTVTLTATRTGGMLGAVTADYNFSGGTATGGAACGGPSGQIDYVNTGGTVSFADGETSKTIMVTICSEIVFEGNETFNVTLSNATGGATIGSPATATVSITDDDSAPSVIVAPTSIAEGNSGDTPVNVVIARVGNPSQAPINVTYHTIDGTAIAGMDYTAVTSGAVQIPAYGSQVNAVIQVTGDTVVEPDEYFTVHLDTTSIGTISQNDQTVTITNDDTTIQFSSAAYTVGEAGPNAILTVTRLGSTAGAITVNYVLANGTATGAGACGPPTSPNDYVSTGSSVMFADGDGASKTILVPICDDIVFDDGDETFTATISIGSGNAALGTPSVSTVTIQDNDSAPTVGVAPASISEGNSGTSNVLVNIFRSGPISESPIDVTFHTVDGTAIAPGDYTAIPAGMVQIPAFGSSVNASITIVGDTSVEPDETFTVHLDSTSVGTIGQNDQAVTILNDDVSLQLSSATYSVGENGATATITVTRSGRSTGAVTVDFATSNGTATGGGSCAFDYISTSGTLMWASGDAAAKTFNVSVCDDTTDEPDETVNLTLSNPSGGASLGTPNSAVLTITDNDPQPSISINDVSLAEGNSGTTAFTFAVTLSNPSSGTITVDAASANGTATAPGDFTAINQTVTFNPGETSKNVTVLVNGDATVEPDETFFINLTNNSSNSSILDGQGLGTITNDDVSLQFSSATYSVGEAGPTATITVTRSGRSSGAVSVSYATSNGTATAGTCGAGGDYVATSGMLSWPDGDAAAKTFSVTVCDDNFDEANETVNLALSSPSGGATLGSPSSSVLTITDNDPPPAISINDVSMAEGNTGTTSFIFSVTLSNPSAGTIVVDYATANGTATAPVDYTAITTQTLTFNPGDTSKQITVLVNGDTTFEPDETFFVNLSGNSSNSTILDGQGLGTIQNDDDTTLTTDFFRSAASGNWGTASTWESSHDGSTNWIPAALSPTSTANTIKVRNGHNVTVSSSVSVDQTTVEAGGQITVNTLVTLTISNGVDAVDLSVAGTINNAGTVTTNGVLGFNSGGRYQHNFAESTGTIPTAIWNAGSTCEIIGYTSNAAAPGGLGQAFANFTWNSPGQTTNINSSGVLTSIAGTFTVQSTGSGSLRLAGSQSPTIMVGSLAVNGGTLVFTNGTGNPTVNVGGDLSIGSGAVLQPALGSGVPILNVGGNWTNDGTFVTSTGLAVTFNGAGSQLVTTGGSGTGKSFVGFVVNKSTGTATLGGALTAATLTLQSGTLDTSPANNFAVSTGAMNIQAGGTLNSNAGTISVTGNWSNAGTFNAGTSTVNLIGSGAQSVSGNSTFYDLNVTGTTARTVTFEATKTQAVTHSLTFGGTAGNLLSLRSSSTPTRWKLNAPATQSVNFVNVQDSDASGGQTVIAANSVDSNNNINWSFPAAGSIQLSSATYSVGENGATATITATRAGGTLGAVGVSYATSDGSATGGGSCGGSIDYLSTSGTLSWANGEGGSKTFSITICDDSIFEANETVNIALTSPTGGATLGTPNTAVLTITENDATPSLQFSSATYTNTDDLAQRSGKANGFVPQTAVITVTRMGSTGNAVSVNYATVSGGTATGGGACATGSGIDYVTASGTLNFAAGDTSKTFNITVCSDNQFEGNETVDLALSSPTAPAVLGTPNTAVLTIIDNDTQPSLQFSSATYSVGEGGGSSTITVTRTGAADNVVAVNYATVAGGTATGGVSCGGLVDHVNTSGTLTFNAGVNSQTFNIAICDDNTVEPDETVNIALSSPTGGATLGAPSTATLTITENDTPFDISSVSPANGVTNVPVNTSIVVTFDRAANPTTITTSGSTSCTASVQLSSDNFATCVPLGSPASSGGNTIFTITPTSLLASTTTYKVRVTTAAQDTFGNALSAQFTQANGFTTRSAFVVAATNPADGQTASANTSISVTLSSAANPSTITSVTTGTACTGSLQVSSDNFATCVAMTGSPVASAGNTIFTVTPAVPLGNGTYRIRVTTAAQSASGFPLDVAYTGTGFFVSTTVMQFSAAGFAGNEGAAVTVTVNRTGGTTGSSTVHYATSNGTAIGGPCGTAGNDYAPASGDLTFNVGDTSKTFTVSLCSDSLSESPAETINLTLSGATGGSVGSQGTAQITIYDVALEYGNTTPLNFSPGQTVSSQATVSGFVGSVSSIRVTLLGVNAATADDIDVLLVAPNGAKYIVMGDVGGNNALTNATLTLEDTALGGFMPDSAPIAPGVNYKPTTCVANESNFGGGAPAGPYVQPGCGPTLTNTMSSTFGGANPNGTWTLYVRNDGGSDPLDGPTDSISGGWGIQFLIPTAASVSLGGRVMTQSGTGIRNAWVTLSGGNLQQPVTVQTGSFGYYYFVGLQPGFTYIVTVSTKRYVVVPPTRVVTVQDNVDDLDFVAEPFE